MEMFQGMNSTSGWRLAAAAGLMVLCGSQATWAADFQTRCAAPGVVKCVGFDSAAEIEAEGRSIDNNRDGTGVAPEFDSSMAASGSGSLRFTIPDHSSSDTSGQWRAPIGHDFGEGETMYVQWRQRFDRAMLETDYGGTGWKHIIIYPDGSSCADLQVVQGNSWLRGYPSVVMSCGSKSTTYAPGEYPYYPDAPTYLYQASPNDYQCLRKNTNPEDCSLYRPDQWMTFYWEIRIGPSGEDGSYVGAWVAYEGEALKQFEDFPFKWNYSAGKTMSWLQLTPYNTDKDSSLSHPTAYTWYDELIISTQPIEAPSGGVVSSPAPAPAPSADTVPPAPPSNVVIIQ
jgi:hypothetical protein